MKLKFGAAFLLFASLVTPTIAAYADDTAQVHPSNQAKGAAISSSIKLKLSAETPPGPVTIVVNTDSKGAVLLTGTANSQAMIDRAEEIARNTVGVNAVTNQIVLKTDN